MSNGAERGTTPHHVGIIMDGNGRWAQMRGLPRTAGHRAGVEAVRRTVEACGELSIRALTLYAFSTENWQRPQAEVSLLMQLIEKWARSELLEMQRNGIRFRLLGRREHLSDPLLRTLDEVAARTQDNDRLLLTLALNYGGRAEIVDTVQAIVAAHKRGELDSAPVDEALFRRYLYCPDLPDADLIIRTAGEQRLSNFLLWRAVGAAFWSTPTLWPDFQREHLFEAVQVHRGQSGARFCLTV